MPLQNKSGLETRKNCSIWSYHSSCALTFSKASSCRKVLHNINTDLADRVVIHAMPEAIGCSHKAVVVARMHRVTFVHEDPVELVRFWSRAPIAHVGCQVQRRVKVHLYVIFGLFIVPETTNLTTYSRKGKSQRAKDFEENHFC